MKYTIELDNDEGRGEVTLIDGIICIMGDDGNVQSTGVHSTLDTLDRDIHAMYGNPVWDLQLVEGGGGDDNMRKVWEKSEKK